MLSTLLLAACSCIHYHATSAPLARARTTLHLRQHEKKTRAHMSQHVPEHGPSWECRLACFDPPPPRSPRGSLSTLRADNSGEFAQKVEFPNSHAQQLLTGRKKPVLRLAGAPRLSLKKVDASRHVRDEGSEPPAPALEKAAERPGRTAPSIAQGPRHHERRQPSALGEPSWTTNPGGSVRLSARACGSHWPQAEDHRLARTRSSARR